MANFTPKKENTSTNRATAERRSERRQTVGLWLAASALVFLVVLILIMATTQPTPTTNRSAAANGVATIIPASPTVVPPTIAPTKTSPATAVPATATATPVTAAQQLPPPTVAAPLSTATALPKATATAGLAQIVPPPTATATPQPLPRLAIFGAGTTLRGDLTTLRPEDSTDKFLAGQEVYAYVNFAQAIPNLDKVEITLISNGTPRPAANYNITKPSGFLIVSLGKLDAGNYKLEVRYNGNLQKQPEFKIAPPPPRMFGVGDSVMLGGSPELRRLMPNFEIDAMVSRQVAAGIAVLRQKQLTGFPDIVVIHLGTNGTFSAQQFDEIMQVLAKVPKVIFVNVSVPRGWQVSNNQVIAEGVKRYPNTVLADWQKISQGHYEYFAADGYHLTYQGAHAMAEMIYALL